MSSKRKTTVFFGSILLSAVLASVLVVGAGGISCTARGSCLTEETPLFSLYWTENSHVGSPDYFDNVICCNQTQHSNEQLTSTFRDNSTPGKVCKQNEEKSILSLYQEDDSHVEDYSLDNYTWQGCVFPYTNCTLRSGGCNSGEECIISLANESNSHVETCDKDNYTNELCCDVPEPDLYSKVCEWNGYRWNYASNDTVEFEQGNRTCCGDDISGTYDEVERIKECTTFICEDDSSDWACCNTQNSCVVNNSCYDQCSMADANNDGYNETCYKGEWKLPDEEGLIRVTGDILGWKSADIIKNADITVKLIRKGEVKDIETTQSGAQGDFSVQVMTPMRSGETYTIRVISEKNGKRSSVEKEFVFHGRGGEYLTECD